MVRHTRMTPILMVLLGSAVLVGGCSTSDRNVSSGAPDGDSTVPGPSGATETTEAPATTEPGPLGSGNPVTIAFAGDASFENLAPAAEANPTGLLSAVTPLLSSADLAMVNVETAVGTGGSPVAKTFTFQTPQASLTALESAGVDVVTMANNHGMDFGLDGLTDTLRIKAEGGLPIIGLGAEENEAYAPFLTEVNGQRVGIIAANDIFDSNLVSSWTAGPAKPGIASAEEAHQDRLVQEVRATRAKVDTLAVYLHYGTEKETCPNARQKELVQLLIGAGADIVVGSHAHRLQGMGYLGDQMVAYGLSNFIFKAPSAEGTKSGVLVVTATGRRIDGYEWKPAQIRNLLPVPLSGSDATAAVDSMNQLQECAELSPTPTGPGVGTETATTAPGTDEG